MQVGAPLWGTFQVARKQGDTLVREPAKTPGRLALDKSSYKEQSRKTVGETQGSPVRSAGRGLGEAQLSGKDAQGDLKQGLAGAALPACVSLMRQESQTHGALLFPAAKPTNWIEGTHTVLRARKGQDDKVLVATCTSATAWALGGKDACAARHPL